MRQQLTTRTYVPVNYGTFSLSLSEEEGHTCWLAESVRGLSLLWHHIFSNFSLILLLVLLLLFLPSWLYVAVSCCSYRSARGRSKLHWFYSICMYVCIDMERDIFTYIPRLCVLLGSLTNSYILLYSMQENSFVWLFLERERKKKNYI